MTCYPIAQQHLCDQLRAAITEALRAGVPVEIVGMALEAAQRELFAAMPLIAAAREGVRKTEGTPT